MTTTSRLAQAVLHMPAMPLRVQLVGRLSEDLRAAIADATFAPADVAVLDASLHQVLNGWSLSVSRFFRVQDEVEAVLTRAMVGRAAGRSRAWRSRGRVPRALEPARRALGVGNRSPRLLTNPPGHWSR